MRCYRRPDVPAKETCSGVWRRVSNLESSLACSFSWNQSSLHLSLLRSLQIDTRNLVWRSHVSLCLACAYNELTQLRRAGDRRASHSRGAGVRVRTRQHAAADPRRWQPDADAAACRTSTCHPEEFAFRTLFIQSPLTLLSQVTPN